MNPILMNPKIDDTASVQIQLKQMKSYLFQFKEQVELLLQNIDKENLSGNLVEDLDTIRGGIRQYEVKIDGFSSKIAQTANMVSAKLSSDDVDAEFIIGRLNDGSTYARISADRIDVDGVFTANGSFTVDANGNLIFQGAGININSASSTTDLIQLNYGSSSSYFRYNELRQNNNNGGVITSMRTSSTGFIIDLYSGGSNKTLLQYRTSDGVVRVGNNTISGLELCDGTNTKKIHWTPLNSLTSDMYVLTDGGT